MFVHVGIYIMNHLLHFACPTIHHQPGLIIEQLYCYFRGHAVNLVRKVRVQVSMKFDILPSARSAVMTSAHAFWSPIMLCAHPGGHMISMITLYNDILHLGYNKLFSDSTMVTEDRCDSFVMYIITDSQGWGLLDAMCAITMQWLWH